MLRPFPRSRELWWRVSERVLARLSLRLGHLSAEVIARHILGRSLDELPGTSRAGAADRLA